MRATRKVYGKEFKDQACRLVMELGYSPQRAARELGIGLTTLSYWLDRRGYKSQAVEHVPPPSDDPKVLQGRIRELEAKLRRLEMEKEILKKATAYFANQSP